MNRGIRESTIPAGKEYKGRQEEVEKLILVFVIFQSACLRGALVGLSTSQRGKNIEWNQWKGLTGVPRCANR